MADQGRWFKLWVSAPDDPDLDNLPIADYGRWAKFGTYLKEHGTDGAVTLQAPCRTLQSKFQVDTFQAVIECIKKFPHCSVSTETNSPVTLKVTWNNWSKYQGDMSTDRVRRWREKQRQHETPKRRGEENKKKPPPSPSAEGTGWGTPQALLTLYNASIPKNHPRATDLRGKRLDKARRYLHLFPEREFWETVFAEVGQSRLLQGLKPSPGHEHFRADFDWLLSGGKDGTDNCVKVREGRYRDPVEQEEPYGFER